jgi:hypothetical protein
MLITKLKDHSKLTKIVQTLVKIIQMLVKVVQRLTKAN